MAKTQVKVEATFLNGRHLVYLHLGGFRFELEAPTPERARQIVTDVLRALGLDT